MNTFYKRLSSGLCMALLATTANAVEVREWHQKPVGIELPVGKERIIDMGHPVKVGFPREIGTSEFIRVQIVGSAVYLKANKAFDTQRVRVLDIKTGKIMLWDVSAKTSGASDEDIKIIEGSAQNDAPNTDASAGSSSEAILPASVILTRYAAQSLYAPSRTIEPVQGVNRSAMRLPSNISSLMPSLPVEALPIAAWTLDNWTVTAVKLLNKDPQRTFQLDPRWLMGDLYSAAFMHPTLKPRGSLEDTTTVFVVTQGQSLAQALKQGGGM